MMEQVSFEVLEQTLQRGCLVESCIIVRKDIFFDNFRGLFL